jgi:two-component system response regulator AlgR
MSTSLSHTSLLQPGDDRPIKVVGHQLRILIVDDEAPARSRLRDLLSDCSHKMAIEIVGEAADGHSALEVLASQPADVVLLDIRMPEMDGIEFAEHLRKLPDPPIVIFTTAYDAYAIKAFELHAVDYLVKPIRLGRLFDALNRVRQLMPVPLDLLPQVKPEPRSHLSVQERGRVHLVPIKEIIYLKAELKYVTIRTAQREYLIEESLTRLEEEFTDKFLRIHRNCLVGRAFVTGFERVTNDNGDGHWVVRLDTLAEKLPVSRRQQHVVREFSGPG